MTFHRPRLRRVAAGVCALALLPAGAWAQQVELRDQLADTADEREQVADRLEDVRDLEDDARSRLAAVDAELDAARERLESLERDLAAAGLAVAQARERERDARLHLAETTERLAAGEVALTDKQAALEARVVAAYKYGQVAFAEVILASQDIADFITSGTYVGRVLESDRELVVEVHDLVVEIDGQRRRARALRVEAEAQAAAVVEATALVAASVDEQRELTELIARRRAEREEIFGALREDRTAMESHLAGLEAESQRITDQLAAIARQQAQEQARREADERARLEEARRQAELDRRREQERLDREAALRCETVTAEAREAALAAGRDASRVAEEPAVVEACGPAPIAATPDVEEGPAATGTDGWVRPVAGALTSPFGPRWGRNHNGVDLAGAVGTSVRSARPGVVVHVTSGCHPTSSWGCGGGFGNYVTVAHDGGLATIYAHLSSVGVGLGSTVSAGTVLGDVGNSGNSYGPHLHFEVREAGVPRDPCGHIAC